MFFNVSIFKVEGFSMFPTISDKAFVLIKTSNLNLSPKKIFVFNHKKYGRLIKSLVKTDSNGEFWFKGNQSDSVSMSDIGPVSENNIIGQVFLSISNNSIKLV
tara:strand:+ start:514 stop:822 length:309 start_codon:yes stop_codon:yes gene_type:complete